MIDPDSLWCGPQSLFRKVMLADIRDRHVPIFFGPSSGPAITGFTGSALHPSHLQVSTVLAAFLGMILPDFSLCCLMSGLCRYRAKFSCTFKLLHNFQGFPRVLVLSSGITMPALWSG